MIQQIPSGKRHKKDSLSLKINITGVVFFLVICTAATLALWPFIGDFIRTPTAFPEFVREHRVWSYGIFIALQILQVVVALIPGEFLEIGAGLAFGWFGGFVLAEIGVASGTVIIFWVFRKLGKPLILRFLSENRLAGLERFNRNPKRDRMIFLIFFIPGLPKDLLTYFGAYFDISLLRFLFLTLLARIPSILTSTVAGQSLIEGKYKTALLIFLITGILALFGFLFSEKIMGWIEKKHSDSF
jgi:uncharacterized membrane protein YdjX (TVP38/TMEM64 family)